MIKGTVLTYHYGSPLAKDTLYLCLDIPAVNIPHERKELLDSETIKQIPPEIMDSVKRICEQNQISFDVIDFEFELEHNKSGERYYRNAPTEEVLRFASVGTEIALQILDIIETGERPWTSDKELADYIQKCLKEELGENYFWLIEAKPFVFNPLRLNDRYMILISSYSNTNALDFLYSKYTS